MLSLIGSQPTKNLPEGSELRFNSEIRGVGGLGPCPGAHRC
jgi:hypothetical protein